MGSRAETRRFYEFPPFWLDPAAGLLFRAGQLVRTTPKVLELLRVLLEHQGQLVTKEELIRAVWPDVLVEEGNLTHNIAMLRKLLGGASEGQEFIETIPKRGYRFIAAVTEVRGMPEPPLRPAPPVRPRSAEHVPRPGMRRWLWAAWAGILVAGALLLLRFTNTRTRQPAVLLREVPLISFSGFAGPPAFSPDASRVVFPCGAAKTASPLAGGHLCVKLIGPGEPVELASHPMGIASPAWSPDGTFIAFLRVLAEARAAVTLIPALGGPERRLTEISWTGSELLGPLLAWSPDGTQLVIVDRRGPGQATSLFRLAVEDGDRRRLTSPPPESLGDSSPVFSPDGRSLAFIRSPSYTVGDIYVLDVTRELGPIAKPRRLTFDGRSYVGMAWAPDGRDIVFASQRLGIRRLWRISRSGSGQPRLVADVGEDVEYPAISTLGPAGASRLVYQHYRRDRNIWRIAILQNARGPQPASAFVASTWDDVSAKYSPDGNRIAFASDRSGTYEIWLCDRDGRNTVQLTSFAGPVVDLPSWSPDGTRIAFHSRPEGRAEIYVLNLDGGRPQRLTYGPGENVAPSWSRDGRWIYFGSTRTGQHEIWKIPSGGGRAVQVTKDGGIVAVESPDGASLYYTKSRGVTSLWKAPAAGGPETQLVGSLFYLGFAVGSHGIYFVPETTAATSSQIQFMDFAGGHVKSIATIESAGRGRIFTVEVSPDEKWLLYSGYPETGEARTELMLVENFR